MISILLLKFNSNILIIMLLVRNHFSIKHLCACTKITSLSLLFIKRTFFKQHIILYINHLQLTLHISLQNSLISPTLFILSHFLTRIKNS